MKTFNLLSFVGLVSHVATEQLNPWRDSPWNISAPHLPSRNALAIDFAASNPVEPGFLVHTSEISDEEYEKATCRGTKLFLAMTHDGNQGTRYINPLASPWDGNLEKEGLEWAWDLWEEEDAWCTFNEEGLSSAFKSLGISDKSVDDGGDNMCYSAFHYNSPAILFDPKDPSYLNDPEGRMLPIDKQYYLDPSGKRKRCTASTYTFGVNPKAGVLYFVSRSSPFETAKGLWKYTPQTSELPDLRASSDFAWGIWNKIRGPENKLGDIRKIMSMYITNKETQDIMDRALAKQNIKEMKMWPGTEVDAKSEEGLALIGSANGRAAGYFLAQHKRQFGKDKYISKINLFRTDKKDKVKRTMLFYVDEVPSPPPEIAEPKDENKDKGTGLVDSKLVDRDNGASNVVRRHVVFAGH